MFDLKQTRIGTSGYSFLDWIGVFYPDGIEKGKMLDYYVNYFDTVEVNSSFYRIPHPKVFENMEKKTPAHFHFIVKGYKGFTHDRTDLKRNADEFRASVEPLRASGKLRGVLLQFPYSFKRDLKNSSYLTRLVDAMAGFSTYVEFRHRGWFRDEVFDMLEHAGANICSVDGPEVDALPRQELHSTAKSIYVRLHGRNAEQWWNGGALRYDYLYSEAQLTEWIRRIRNCGKPVQSAYVFFNNCHRGQAVQNAGMLAELIRRDKSSEGTE